MFTPKYFQEKATELAVQELSTADNALVVMCCGSGKTYTGAMIADRLHALVTVIVAPTIMLVDQIADEYRQTTDRRVFQYHSENAIEPEVFLGEHPGKRAIVTTYNSAPVLLTVLAESGIQVDLVIYDEMHRTAGKLSTLFNQTLTGYPNVIKRLGMTATPRHASYNEKDDDTEFFSMDNEELYGKLVYTYQIREAIEDGVISDYKLLVACVTDDEVRSYLKEKTISTSEHKTYAIALTLKRAMEQYGLKKVITYHATIDEASKAATIFSDVLDTPVTHVSSLQGPYTRNAHFAIYKDSDSCVITNARCLNEGMNVPATDATMFCSSKTSPIDIIQCAGRAMRKYPGKDFGYIILPVLSGDNAVEYSDFSAIMQVLNSLSENDELLHRAIKLYSPDSSTPGHTLLPSFFRYTDDSSFDVHKLADLIYLKVYTSFNKTFLDRVEQLKEFISINGHSRVLTANAGSFGIWVKHMRALYARNRLDPEKKRILDELGFIWDYNQELFYQNLEELRAYLEAGNTVSDASTGPFLQFIKARRAAHRSGTLPAYQEDALNSLGVTFDISKHNFEANLRLLKTEVNDSGEVTKGSALVDWVKYQRKKYLNNELTEEQVSALIQTGLKLDIAGERDRSFFTKLAELAETLRDNRRVTPSMNSFRGVIRRRYKIKTLEQDRLAKIRELEKLYNIQIVEPNQDTPSGT
ncbi:Helicase associated domain protein (plasmid) [Serratia sp. JSRIV001]|uniref:DEAD/DEAH box helicase n=1 Tax=unclassified Serratia (in: enterobacteria) TaxID=2647522 RepID=UPI001CBF9325|nr:MULTISPECIES: DEAD/DEAH box helicase [unclassified Serratia (in: enterobacteria)]UAN48773.1 Helicase associated domain protein [Serratia sp. JSRIV001]UAN54476.1 Helicase associated domain protein [Serratia sp. JSRIV002]UAN60589.1 Helicase associated domain protein [Serratia sp. JSRIV004]